MTDSALPKPAAARYRSGVLGLRLAQSLLLCCCGRLSPSQPAHPSLALASPYPAHSLDALISTRLPRHRSHLRREAAQEAAHLHHPRRRGLVRTLREDLDSCGGSAEMITGGRRQGGRRGRPRRPRRQASDGARDALLPRVHARGLARHAKHKDPTRFLLLSQFNLRCDLATFVRKPACQSRLCGTERDVMHGTRSGSRALRGHGATAPRPGGPPQASGAGSAAATTACGACLSLCGGVLS